jgi:hypothetical protein
MRNFRLGLGGRISVMALPVLFLVLLCLVGPSVLYCDVAAPVDRWPKTSGEQEWVCDDFFNLWPPDYVVRDGRLYLRVQTVRHSPLLVSFVSFGHWDAQKIEKLRRAHPELERYWPDRVGRVPGSSGPPGIRRSSRRGMQSPLPRSFRIEVSHHPQAPQLPDALGVQAQHLR